MLSRLLLRYLRAADHPAKLRLVTWLGKTAIPAIGLEKRLPEGLVFYLHPRDTIEHILLRGDRYEPATLELLQKNLRSGDGAILAGINFGLHVAVCARAVGEDGRVVGVEPQAAAVLRTRLNLERNGLSSRVDLLQAALGEKPEILRMAWSQMHNPGAASLFDEGEGFSVPAVTLEEATPLLAARRFRVLLLDVQGYEFHVLAGADFARGPEIAIVELDAGFLERSGISAQSIAGLLERAGYHLFDVYGRAVQALDAGLPENNLVAKRPEANIEWPAVR